MDLLRVLLEQGWARGPGGASSPSQCPVPWASSGGTLTGQKRETERAGRWLSRRHSPSTQLLASRKIS